MSGDSFLSFGSSKTKTTMDPRSRQTWFGNIDQANALPGFQGLTPDYLAAFRDPYEDQAVRGTLADLEYQRHLAAQATGDAASAAGAFGGSRHGVADALTNAAFARQGAQASSQMRSQGHWQALQSALEQLLAQNQYRLQRQGTINDAVRLLQPNTKSSTSEFGGKLTAGDLMAMLGGGK